MDVVGDWVVKTMKGQSMPEIETLENAAALADTAARKFVTLCECSVADRGRFAVALSGVLPPGTYTPD